MRVMTGLRIAAALAVTGGVLSVPAITAATTNATAVTIAVHGIDRSGAQADLSYNAIAVPLTRGRQYAGHYQANAHGELKVPAGTYLVGVSINTPVSGGDNVTDTLAVHVVRARSNTAVTFDARAGRPVGVVLATAGVHSRSVSGAVCVGTGSSMVTLAAAAGLTSSGTPLYAVPFSRQGLTFGYGGSWTNASGTPYYVVGSKPGGIPANLNLTLPAAGLARLTLQASAGASQGSTGHWDLKTRNSCGFVVFDGGQATPMPSRLTQYVSPGDWEASFAADDKADDTTSVFRTVRAGRRVTMVVGGAVRSPSKFTLPKFSPNRAFNIYSQLTGLLADPAAAGEACCTAGSVILSGHGAVIKHYQFKRGNGDVFTANLRRPGWYEIRLSAHRDAPPAGVAAAVLSTRLSLIWRFRASVADITMPVAGVPVSVSTFLPQLLDLNNHAAPHARTAVHVSVWRGLQRRAFSIKTVRLEASNDGGKAWHLVPVVAHRTFWLAQVPDPASGYVALRSIVTDIKGDSTVETIYRAYGISCAFTARVAAPRRARSGG